MDPLRELRTRDVLERLHDGACLAGADRRILLWNEAAERITGRGREDASLELCGSERCPLAAAIEDGVCLDLDALLKHADGGNVPVRLRVTPVRAAGEDGGVVVGALAIFREAGEVEALREEVSLLRRHAMVDTATGLANRHFLERTLRARLEELERYDRDFGVLLVAPDALPEGAEADERLRAVAGSVQRCVRSFDVVGRWSAGRFVVVAIAVDEDQLAAFAERVRRSVADGAGNGATVTIGAAVAFSTDDVGSLVARAQERLRAAREGGPNRSCATDG